MMNTEINRHPLSGPSGEHGPMHRPSVDLHSYPVAHARLCREYTVFGLNHGT